jgi:hypothetical protein
LIFISLGSIHWFSSPEAEAEEFTQSIFSQSSFTEQIHQEATYSGVSLLNKWAEATLINGKISLFPLLPSFLPFNNLFQ